jgi:AcrR family transcriptional regulator
MGIAVFVELEQLRRQRFAAGMALALVLIDVDLQLCHGKRFLLWRAGFRSSRGLPVLVTRGFLPSARLSYMVLHSRLRHSSSEKNRQMSRQLIRKPQNTYHHGDLRDALVQAALREAERGGPEAISIKALAKELGVSQPAPYRHFADREALLQAVTAEAFRQFNAVLHEAVDKPSKRSKLSRFAQAALEFGLERNGIYRLMFASRTMACAAKDSELHLAARETLYLLVESFEAPAVGLLRERHALQVWASLHGVISLAEQGLLTGEPAKVTRQELIEDIVQQTKMALTLAIENAGGADPKNSPSS